ncbi:MAG: hypothetical protein ACRBI6_11160 [Acidimicrobiales bacterium]
MNTIESTLADVLAPDEPSRTDQITDKVADMVLDHSKEFATSVVLPAAKYTLSAKLFRNRRRIGASTIVAIGVIGVAVYAWRKRPWASDDGGEADILADIPTIEDRQAA